MLVAAPRHSCVHCDLVTLMVILDGLVALGRDLQSSAMLLHAPEPLESRGYVYL